VIAFSDVLDPGDQPGEPETIVTRTWTATDFCNHQSSCIQTITLLSPGNPLQARLDLMPGACPNTASLNPTGVVTLVLYGTSTFDVSQVDRNSLVLQRKDNVGTQIDRMNIKVKDKGRPASSSAACACGQAALDGRLDLQLSLDFAAFTQAFDVLTEAPGTQLNIALTGRLLNGQYFTVADCMGTP
jgi:hypothetical protein